MRERHVVSDTCSPDSGPDVMVVGIVFVTHDDSRKVVTRQTRVTLHLICHLSLTLK